MSQIFQFIKRHDTEPPSKRLSTHCASAHKIFKLGRSGSGRKSWWQKQGFMKRRSGLGKKFKISAGRRILEIRDGCGEKYQGCPGTLALTPETNLTLGGYTPQADRTFCPALWTRSDLPTGKENQALMNVVPGVCE